IPSIRAFNPDVPYLLDRLILDCLTDKDEHFRRPRIREFWQTIQDLRSFPTLGRHYGPDRPHSHMFVGRDAEIALCREHLRSTHLIAIAGESGIGKSTLAAQVASISEARSRVF